MGRASAATVTTATPKTHISSIGYSPDRVFFRTSDNKLVLIYSDTGHIYYRLSSDNGSTWGSAVNIKYVDDYTGYSFSGYIDNNDNIYLAYNPHRGASQYVFMIKMTYSAGSYALGPERTVESTGASTQAAPNIIKDPSNNLWVTYVYANGSNYSINVRESVDDGATWGASTQLSSSTSVALGSEFSSLAIYNNQYPVVAYVLYQSGASRVYYRAYNGASWSTEGVIDANTSQTPNFSLVKVGAQVYYAGGYPGTGPMNYSVFNGTSWTAISTVNAAAADTYDPQLVTDGLNVWLFYVHYNGTANNYDIYYKKFNGSIWDTDGTAVTTSGINNRYPHVPQSVVSSATIPLVYQSGTVAPYTVYVDAITPPDAAPPTITAFSMPATSASTTVDVTNLAATDNIGVTGYLITESASTPSSGDSGWSSGVPTNFTFSSAGVKTAYAWAKDAIGNVSSGASQTVTITLPTYTIGGTVSGLSGTVELQNNAGDNLSVSADGSFTFGTSLNSGAVYAAIVITQPIGQTCSVANGSGTVLSSNVTDISVSCVSGSDTTLPTVDVFTIPASAVSLTVDITSLTATDNVGVTGYHLTESPTAPPSDDVGWTASAPATYSFSSGGVKTLYAWAKDAAGNVSLSLSASVTVTLPTYTIGGTISGLSGTIVLQNNGSDDYATSTNGSFAFATGLNSGAAYAVTVSTQPSGQSCVVSGGSGTLSSSDVTTVSVVCADLPTLSIIPNGTDSNPNSPLHMLPGATKRIYANQCVGSQSLGCTSTEPTIAWSGTCGTFSSSTGPFVDYTAPASGNSCVITATDATDSLVATATATIEHPPVTINVIPHAITLYKGQHQLLQAIVMGSSDRGVNWASTGGTLTAQGWTADFVAASQGIYTVTATSQADNTKIFSATIYVTDTLMPTSATANHTEPVDCTATGSGNTYDVGPSQTYTTINAVPWNSIGPGDTVRIHNEGGEGSPTTYHERWLISTSGTATEPIRICGVPNNNRELPVIDGESSVTSAAYSYHGLDGLGIINIYAGYGSPGDSANYVQFVTIEGLKIIHAQSNPAQQYYSQSSGTLTAFPRGTAGIRVQSGANIILRGIDFENNDNGFFSNAQIPETLMSRWHLIQGNYFKDNGTIGDTHDHSIYAQAFGQVVQGNYFDDKVNGDQGSQIKTRSAANFVRYNYLQAVTNTSLGRMLDLVSPESSNGEATVQEFIANIPNFTTQTIAGVTAMEDWYNSYVYGNIFNDALSIYPIHYSEDNCAEDVTGLPGYFYNNTFYEHGSTAWRWYFIDGDYGSGGPSGCFPAKPRTRFPQAVLINNAIKLSATSITNPYFYWTKNIETPLYLYTNWISSAWGHGGLGGADGNGTAYQQTQGGVSYMTGNTAQHVYVGSTGLTCSDATCGGELILGNTTTEMPFSATTYRPLDGSPLINASASPLSGIVSLPVTYQYDPNTYLLSTRANASDIGALSYASPDTTSPTVTAFTIPSTSSSRTVPISAFTATDNTAVTGYLVNESATTPSAGDSGWSATAPTTYTFLSDGLKTLYAWAKDAAGNISTSLSASVTVDTSTPAPITTTTTTPTPHGSISIPALGLPSTPNPLPGQTATQAARSTGLTSSQVTSILNVLTSFNVDPAVLANVSAILHGTTTSLQPTTQAASSFTFTRNLELHQTGPDVTALQRYLNTHGFPVSATGPGSLNNETATFGFSTYRALVRYQLAHHIYPAGGFFGPVTRAAVGE